MPTRGRLKITNHEALKIIPKGTEAQFTLDHSSLVKVKKSVMTGADVRVVYFDGHSFTELGRGVKNNWNSDSSTVFFDLVKDVGVGKTAQGYFLYYGI